MKPVLQNDPPTFIHHIYAHACYWNNTIWTLIPGKQSCILCATLEDTARRCILLPAPVNVPALRRHACKYRVSPSVFRLLIFPPSICVLTCSIWVSTKNEILPLHCNTTFHLYTIYVRATCFELVGHPQTLQENRSKRCLDFLLYGIQNAYKFQ